MASVRTEFLIEADVERVWRVIRDFESGPVRMAPGYVVGCTVEADVRVVTFANGVVARERLIGIDEDARRIVYALIGDTIRPEHNNASMQVVAEGVGHSRFIWIHDVLPDDFAEPLRTAMIDGGKVIKKAFAQKSTPAQSA
jgi:hypothetical protein